MFITHTLDDCHNKDNTSTSILDVKMENPMLKRILFDAMSDDTCNTSWKNMRVVPQQTRVDDTMGTDDGVCGSNDFDMGYRIVVDLVGLEIEVGAAEQTLPQSESTRFDTGRQQRQNNNNI